MIITTLSIIVVQARLHCPKPSTLCEGYEMSCFDPSICKYRATGKRNDRLRVPPLHRHKHSENGRKSRQSFCPCKLSTALLRSSNRSSWVPSSSCQTYNAPIVPSSDFAANRKKCLRLNFGGMTLESRSATGPLLFAM
jgi:hypothetical protein